MKKLFSIDLSNNLPNNYYFHILAIPKYREYLHIYTCRQALHRYPSPSHLLYLARSLPRTFSVEPFSLTPILPHTFSSSQLLHGALHPRAVSRMFSPSHACDTVSLRWCRLSIPSRNIGTLVHPERRCRWYAAQLVSCCTAIVLASSSEGQATDWRDRWPTGDGE